MREHRTWDDGILVLQLADEFLHIVLRVEAHAVHAGIQLDMDRETGYSLFLSCLDERIEQILTLHQAQAETASARPQSEMALGAERDFLLKEKQQPQARELADGIILTELKHGTGARPGVQDSVLVNYVGRLPDGTIFDQSTQPQWFRLDSVIAGWRSALVQMPVGAKWRLAIPSSQAYGTEGAGDLIAPYTPLVFEVELLDIRK